MLLKIFLMCLFLILPLTLGVGISSAVVANTDAAIIDIEASSFASEVILLTKISNSALNNQQEAATIQPASNLVAVSTTAKIEKMATFLGVKLLMKVPISVSSVIAPLSVSVDAENSVPTGVEVLHLKLPNSSPSARTLTTIHARALV